MPESPPRVEQQDAPAGARLLVLGRWTAAQFAQPGLLKQVSAALARTDAQRAWDLRQAEQLDHVGAQLLWDAWGTKWPKQLETSPAQRAVLERVASYTVPPRRRKRAS